MQLMAAPDLPEGLEWLNTDHPLALRDLAGRVVLLSFGTFVCSNCTRLVPELHRLKEEHPELVVIEIHSPALEPDQVTVNVREAVRRAGMDHPVAIDRERQAWRAFGVREWPTFILIDPAGNVVGRTTGEGLYRRLSPKIGRIAEEFDRRGLLVKQPLPSAAAAQAGSLYHPGKVAADTAGMRLFVSDSGHHRIVVADPGGRILETIGSGIPGDADGSFAEAAFYRPEGLAFDEAAGILYVADAGNHTIRQVSWADRSVVTVAGTGLQAPAAGVAGPGPDTALNTPQDLALMGGHLYIAMAGANQIWRMDLATHEVEPYAGSGREALVDGPLASAAFAGPSGIVTDGEALFVADREASAVRRIKRGMVETFIGHSPDDFGDLDTIAGMARIHHAAGVAYHQGLLYLADTENHKVKEFDPATGWVLTRVGNGNRGYRDGLSGDARLNEPHDLVQMGGLWYIADTGNHLVRVYDPDRHAVSTLNLWR